MKRYYTNTIQQNGRIYTRGYDSGKQYFNKIKYKPSLWVKGNGDYTDISGKISLTKKSFRSIKESRDYIKQYTGVFDIYGDLQNQYKYIAESWVNEIEFDSSDIRVLNFDIETMSPPEGGFPYPDKANAEINAITIEYNNSYFTFGTGDYTPKADNSKYIKCDNEIDLLTKFVNLWSFISPDVITGWNIKFFDVPYIINRISKIISPEFANKLSPWGKVISKNVKTVFGKEQQTYDILGVSNLDYVIIYKKFTFVTRESYTLNNIAFEELHEKKLDYSAYENLFNLYEKNYELFIDYNIKDVELVKRLDDKLNLLNLLYTTSYKAKCNYEDVIGTLKVWDVICYNHLINKKMVVQSKKESISRDFVGGYVKDSHVGRHKWVMSFDLTSLYPHLIMQYNISPETIIRKIDRITIDSLLNKEIDTKSLLSENESLSGNGVVYDTNKRGFIPELMELYFKERKNAKNLMLKAARSGDSDAEKKNDVKQMSLKILLNSLYGAIGNKYFRHFDVDMAESITTSGQLSIRWIDKALNGYINDIMKTDSYDYIVASDTDSVYVSFEKLIEKILPNASDEKITDFLDKISKEKLQPFIDNSYKELSVYMNAYEQKMYMDRENISNNAVFFAKKRYIMNVLDNEGTRYSEPKIKMMGIEAIKSSTPSICRKSLKEFIKIILNGTEKDAQDYYKNFKEEFKKTNYIDIAFPRTANNLDKFYDPTTLFKKGTPIHVRGSLLYNFAIKNMGIDSKYEYIENGTKIKFCYLKVPNPLKSNVISVPSVLPKELELDQYIDYNLQFEKAFLMPVENMLKSINWTPEKRNTLEKFFI